MGLSDRVNRVVRSELSYRGSANSDPNLVVDRALNDLRQSILNLQRSLALAESSYKALEVQHQKTLADVAMWSERVVRATQKNRPDLAKESLIREQANKQRAIDQRSQLKEQKTHIGNLKNNLQSLKNKLSELEQKRASLIPPKTSAIDIGCPSKQFESATRKLESMLEHRSKAQDFSLAPAQDTDDVDDQLRELKEQLLGRSSKRQTSDVDDELEELKRQLQQLDQASTGNAASHAEDQTEDQPTPRWNLAPWEQPSHDQRILIWNSQTEDVEFAVFRNGAFCQEGRDIEAMEEVYWLPIPKGPNFLSTKGMGKS